MLFLIARSASGEGLPIPAGLGRMASAVGNEAVAQLTTNPPSPDLGGRGGPDADAPTPLRRLARTNADALRAIGSSWSTFFHHPWQSLGPVLKSGAQASVQPILHPEQTISSLKDYYRKKGVIDGVAQTIYAVSNVVSVGCILTGAAAVLGMAVGLPSAAVIGHLALHGLEVAGAVGLVSGLAQLAFDEAQSAARTSGTRWPSWVPVLGGRPLFRPTTHQQQVDLLKFDVLNAGGSVLMLGFAKVGEHGGGLASYGGLAGSELGIVAGVTPTDASTKYEALCKAAAQGDLAAARAAQADYRAARQAVQRERQ